MNLPISGVKPQGVVVVISPDDILMIKTFFEQDGNEALSVSFWQVDDVVPQPTTEVQAAKWYHSSYYAKIGESLLHESAKMTRTVVDNLSAGDLYGEWLEELFGGMTGEPAPSYVAIDVKQSVGSRLTRAGRKRLPFIGEVVISGNAVLLTGIDVLNVETWFGTIAVLTDPLAPFGVLNLLPVIVGRTEQPIGSGNYVLDLSKINRVTGAEIQGNTTQNTRKP